MRFVGVDPGGRRMGFAVGDDRTGIASPLAVVPYEGLDRSAERIVALAREVDAEMVVLGLPTLEDGSCSPASRRSQRLADALTARGMKIVLQPEFLSSNEARRRARAIGRGGRQPVDDIAAQVILEEYLASQTSPSAAES